MGYAQDDSYIDPSVPEAISDVLHDPQTSGGLLVSVPADIAEEVAADMLANGSFTAEIVGEVIEKQEKYLEVY